MTVPEELAEIRQWWARRAGTASRSTERVGNTAGQDSPDAPEPPEPREPPEPQAARLAGGPYDQRIPAGRENPYWQIVRQLPAVPGTGGAHPDGFARGLPVGHHLLAARYAWAIASPGDIAWLARTVRGRGLVEIGAGSGYWAWQAAQAGIDVVAYEPADPAVNPYTDGVEYFPLRRADHTAAARHPDRALMLCWPSTGEPWAARALDVYTGDLLIYIGEERGGRCADEGFFRLLEQEWRPIGSSPHHVAWRHTTCTMTAFRRV